MKDSDYDEQYKRKERRKRFFVLGVVIAAITSTNIIVAPNPLPKPDYVPTIANGLVTSASILMAFAIFSVTHFHASISSSLTKQRYHNLATMYLMSLFLCLMLDIVIGYRLLLTDALGYAFSWFMGLLIVMCGLIIDMWITSERFYLD